MIITSQGKAILQYTLNLWIWFFHHRMAIALGVKWSQVPHKYTYHSWSLYVLTTICYIEWCLLFEFCLGKLIHDGGTESRTMLSGILLKNITQNFPTQLICCRNTIQDVSPQAHTWGLFVEALIKNSGSFSNPVCYLSVMDSNHSKWI